MAHNFEFETELKNRLAKFDETVDKYSASKSPEGNLAIAHLAQAQATVIAAMVEKVK